MEKPDSEGYVHINWPSRNIPHGGIFHTKVVKHSTERETFLRVLLEESRINMEQRKKSAWGLRQNEIEQSHQELIVPQVRPRTSRRRSLSAIRESGALDIEDYRPQLRGEDREQLKMRLQQQMAWGDSEPPSTEPHPHRVVPSSKNALPTAQEMRNELLTQIRERAEWLADMEALGKGAEHRDIVRDQIAERLRSLEALGAGSARGSARSVLKGWTPEDVEKTARSAVSSTRAVRTNRSLNSQPKQSARVSAQQTKCKEENVASYKFSPLQYSPRRRC